MTATHKNIVHDILQLPDAPSIVQEVTDALAEEQKRRIDFYNDIDDDVKAEFINGEVVIHSPVKKRHTSAAGRLYKLISTYVERFRLGFVGYEKTMIECTRNSYEPDVCYFDNQKAKHFDDDQSIYPPADLTVEVLSKSTAPKDRGIKFEDYAANHIREYWIIDPVKETVEQYQLDETGTYELILKSGEGRIKCEVVEGFNIPIRAIFDADENLKVLGEILSK